MSLVDEYIAEMRKLEQRRAEVLRQARRTRSANTYRRAARLSRILDDMAYAVGEMQRPGRIYTINRERG